MQTLLANYLFTYKKCNLSSVGILQIKNIAANSVFGERSITAPISVIDFSEEDTSSDLEEDFIAANKKISKQEAAFELNSFTEKINNLTTGQFIEFSFVGKFYKNDVDKIVFTANENPAAFSPYVIADRVVHPHESHNMLVGENQTNTAAMAEYYLDEEEIKTDKWWLWAMVLLATSLAIIGIYASQNSGNLMYRN